MFVLDKYIRKVIEFFLAGAFLRARTIIFVLDDININIYIWNIHTSVRYVYIYIGVKNCPSSENS